MPNKTQSQSRDYSLIGKETSKAIQSGLAEAVWYTSPVSYEKMRELLERKNGPAIRDTIIWFSLLFASGIGIYLLWGTWRAILPIIIYSTLYASTSDSRWHESSHGTAFKTDWMNNVLYEISSFMVFRQSTVWRWSHTRHHSDTIIRGRDPEIAVPRPPNIISIILNFFGIKSFLSEGKKVLIHASGKIDKEVATYLPKSDYKKVILKARIYIAIYTVIILLAILKQSFLPLFYIGFPTFLGFWLMPIYGLTQHAGLAENVLDHRLNCRTVYMNRINRFFYWNMNYHIEHHMFPLVPYHALPKLHEEIKNDCPPPYKNIVSAFKEIVPALLKQKENPEFFVERKLPESSNITLSKKVKFINHSENKTENNLIEICETKQLPEGEVIRFDLDDETYAIYNVKGNYYASEGICTHGNTHLSDGLIINNQIECSKHNGRFEISDGTPKRLPACIGLKTYKVVENEGHLFFDTGFLTNSKSIGSEQNEFIVISNKNLTPFIKELILKPVNKEYLKFTPGDYLQFHIPPFHISFADFELDNKYHRIWKEQNMFRYFASNSTKTKRNFSIAGIPSDNTLKFNVRIALPPPGVNCSAGVGSSYIFNLKENDIVKTTESQGDFHIKESDNEMIYIGGGAGMAPIRSHITFLLQTIKTKRKISFWYGARTQQDLFYTDFFNELEQKHPNFSFHFAFSEASKKENNKNHSGFIHEKVKQKLFNEKRNFRDTEFYLCGPPKMVEATQQMLSEFNIDKNKISFDEF